MNDLEMGLQAMRAGRFTTARDCFINVVRNNPHHPDGYHLLADALRRLREWAAARQALNDAITLNPNQFEYHRTLGHLMLDQNYLAMAAISYERALNINPQDVVSLLNLGIICISLGQYAKARQLCERAVRIEPGNPVAHVNLGSALMGDRKFDAAIDCYNRAIAINPNIPLAHYNLGCCLKEIGRVQPAIDSLVRALNLQPNLRECCDCLMHLLLFQPVFNRSLFTQVVEHWRRLLPAANPPARVDHAGRAIRVGFVSADLHEHPVGRFMSRLLPRLDPAEFFIIAYSDSPRDDDIQRQIRDSCALWHNTRGLDDDALDRRIRDDQVDLLIDLSLHTIGNRLSVLARKPAPVQANWLGYCSTTGLPAIDFRITDSALDPPESLDPIYCEKSIHLPRAWWCYPQPPVPVEIGVKPEGPVFGCLNAVTKINDAVLDAWSRILSRTPGSSMILYAELDVSRRMILDHFAKSGIDARRIEFVGKQTLGDYLRTCNRFNIALDPFPYNGGTTTCDALYMGVPVVSFKGDRAMGRMGASILNAVGLPELCGHSVEDYIRIAVELASDPQWRRRLNESLHERMKNSVLMDADAFAKDFSAVLKRMARGVISDGRD